MARGAPQDLLPGYGLQTNKMLAGPGSGLSFSECEVCCTLTVKQPCSAEPGTGNTVVKYRNRGGARVKPAAVVEHPHKVGFKSEIQGKYIVSDYTEHFRKLDGAILENIFALLRR